MAPEAGTIGRRLPSSIEVANLLRLADCLNSGELTLESMQDYTLLAVRLNLYEYFRAFGLLPNVEARVMIE